MEKINLQDIRKIIISRTDNLGDVILTLPLINNIKKIFPDADIYFLLKKSFNELLYDYQGLNKLVFIEDLQTGKILKEYFVREQFDAGINVFPVLKISYAMFDAGIKIRAGTGYRWFSFLYNYRLYEHRKYAKKHESEYNLNLLTLLTEKKVFPAEFNFKIINEEKKLLNLKLKNFNLQLRDKYLIVHPFSRKSAKDIPTDKIIQIVSSIVRRFGFLKVVITGTAEESEKIKHLLNQIDLNIKHKIINLSGELSLRELMILIYDSVLFISNSTGPVHIAGALNKDIIAFYPKTKPMNKERWKPLSSKSHVFEPEDEKDDMNSINVEKVLETASEIIREKETF